MACYYTGAQNGINCYELYNKSQLVGEISTITSAATEVIMSKGQKIDYYVNSYSPLSADNFYGEQPTSKYLGPTEFKLMIQLSENATNLSRFGFSADDEITAYITYELFEKAFENTTIYTSLSQDVEPKSGDVFQMTEYGSDRINGRAGNYFQITQRLDQDIADSNPLGAHFMWKLKVKRLEYSFEPGLVGESVNQQINDDTFYGRLSGSLLNEPTSAPNIIPGSANEDKSKFNIVNERINNDVYGDYN